MRRISWIRAVQKEFLTFPQAVQERVKFALQIAAAGQIADLAKPMKGFDGGIYEIACPIAAMPIAPSMPLSSATSFGCCTLFRRSRRVESRRRSTRSRSFANV